MFVFRPGIDKVDDYQTKDFLKIISAGGEIISQMTCDDRIVYIIRTKK